MTNIGIEDCICTSGRWRPSWIYQLPDIYVTVLMDADIVGVAVGFPLPATFIVCYLSGICVFGITSAMLISG
jgi:hypothetical protein